MTKLFTRVFASLPDDVKHDEELSEKMALIQQFIRPESLDIKPIFQNETSWLVSMPPFKLFSLCCILSTSLYRWYMPGFLLTLKSFSHVK